MESEAICFPTSRRRCPEEHIRARCRPEERIRAGVIKSCEGFSREVSIEGAPLESVLLVSKNATIRSDCAWWGGKLSFRSVIAGSRRKLDLVFCR